MTDYTLTMVAVRAWFPHKDDREKFDRALAAHERKIAARVWEEGWNACVEYMNGPDWGQTLPNPYLERDDQ